jgi:hypothetical protein
VRILQETPSSAFAREQMLRDGVRRLALGEKAASLGV